MVEILVIFGGPAPFLEVSEIRGIVEIVEKKLNQSARSMKKNATVENDSIDENLEVE